MTETRYSKFYVALDTRPTAPLLSNLICDCLVTKHIQEFYDTDIKIYIYLLVYFLQLYGINSDNCIAKIVLTKH